MNRRRRVGALVVLAATIVAGLLVHGVLADTAATDILGDALYAVAAYTFVVLLAPRWHPLVVGSVAAVWCVLVELAQLTGIPERWGAAFPPAMLVFGTVFDPRDLVVYVSAIAAAMLIDVGVRSVVRRREPDR